MINAQDAYNQSIQNLNNFKEQELQSVEEQITNAISAGEFQVQLTQQKLCKRTINELQALEYKLQYPLNAGVIVIWEHKKPYQQDWRDNIRW